VQQGNLRELHRCRRALGISHLLFADDTLMFFQARKKQAQVVNLVLRRYYVGTGQLINPSKCSVMFGSQCSASNQDRVKAILHVEIMASEEKYFDLPTPDGRMTKNMFKSTKERMAKKFTNWEERYMPLGAKVVLIKAVAQAMPTYVMGVFKLPATYVRS
jgi:hypothetical protein